MSRYAILLANSAKADDPTLSVGATEARQNLEDFQDRLRHLGKQSFESTSLVDENCDDARTKIGKIAKKLVHDNSPDSCLLFYYFGHGVERSNDLHILFKDSNSAVLPSMLAFQGIADTLFGYGHERILFILDCCFAGAAAFKVYNAARPGSQFSILASTVPTQLAMVQAGPHPFGAFSQYIFSGLRHIDASEAKKVTVATLFRYTREQLQMSGHQQVPYNVDGGVDDFLLT